MSNKLKKDAEKQRIFSEMPPLTVEERKNIIKRKKNVTGVERIMKFCSSLNKIFRYPYFFNWSTPTNYFDNSPKGSYKDISYVIFRVGKYMEKDREQRSLPTEKQIYFGPIFKFNNDEPLKTLAFLFNVENESLDSLKEKIDDFLEKEWNEYTKLIKFNWY